MRGAELVSGRELLEPENPEASTREMKKGRAPHRAKSDHDRIIIARLPRTGSPMTLVVRRHYSPTFVEPARGAYALQRVSSRKLRSKGFVLWPDGEAYPPILRSSWILM